jgi:IS5 family transposase
MQVIADPAVRLIWVSPTLRGARHDIAAAREHGILDALSAASLRVLADRGYQGAGPAVAVPQRRRRLDPGTGCYRPLSQNQKDVNTAHARLRGPGEHANQLKSWKILRKTRISPSDATTLVNTVQTLILAT